MKKNKAKGVSVTGEFYERVKAAAKANGRSVGNLTEEAVTQALDREEKPTTN